MPECAFTGAGDGTLRLWKVESVRAWDRVGAFVAVIERIPALLVIPFGNSDKLGDPVLVDLENAPTDVAVVNDTCVVSFNAPADKLFAIVRYNGEYEVDAQNDMLELVESPESENQITVPSIFVWGNKMYLERPQGEEE
ncbi:hypothetical protein GGI07_001562 [Coemansia sp. Benny D115]|nr:hypothetical protein GGI07_001562 [Coemansia sp. Benny D115]